MITWPLVPIALFYFLCATVGVIGNAIMIIVFVQEQKFRNTCNYLITLNCLADLFHLSGHFVFNAQVLTGTTCSQATCFYVLLLSAVGLCISGPFLLAIGVDRYISCKFPMIYRAYFDNSNFYLFVLIAFPVAFAAALMFDAFIFRDFESQVTCMAPLALPRNTFQIYTFSSNLINVAIVVIYLATYAVLRNYSARGAEKMRQVFKSIAVTVIFVLLGWSTVAIGNSIIFMLVDDKNTANILSIHAGFGVNVACAINVFVFYKINTEYRISIRSMFGIKADIHPIGSFGERRQSIVAISNNVETIYQ